MVTISPDIIDAPALLQAFEQRTNGAGAIVTFAGKVRPDSTSGAVQSLYLQAYPEMTEPGIKQAVASAQSRWPLTGVQVVHRTGEMTPGETIVFVATASAHRRAAFEAADFLMDYLKTEAVFWKREDTEHGAAWIEPKANDYEDAKRWGLTAQSDDAKP